MSQRRRKFLQALGVTAAGSLAGCTGSLPLGGNDESSAAAIPSGLDALTLPASTAWFQHEDLQAAGNDKLSEQVTTLFDTDRSNLDALVRVLRKSDSNLPTFMISGSFDSKAVAKSVYQNYVIPRVKNNSNLSKDDVKAETKNGFRQLTNDTLGQFAINNQVVLVQMRPRRGSDLSFNLAPFLELYNEDTPTLFEESSQTKSLLSTIDLQASSTWFDLTSNLADSPFLQGGSQVNLQKLSAVGATQIVRTGEKSSSAFAAHFESEPTETKISNIEEASVFSHVETTGNIAVFEATQSEADGQDI